MIFILRVLHHNELELTASKASLDYMKGAVDELTNSRNERLRAREILLMKHKKIEDFEKLAVSSLFTDVGLFFFSFFSKTSASARKKNKERLWTSLGKKRFIESLPHVKPYIFFFPHSYPLALAVTKSPAVFIFYHARSTDFEEKIEGL